MKILFALLLTFCNYAFSAGVLQEALGKEIYETYVSESNEFIQEEKDNKVIYTEPSIENYKVKVNKLCTTYKVENCPEVFYTKKNTLAVAGIYPNNILLIKKEKIELLDNNESTFILAHEFAHFYLNHTLLRSKMMGEYLIDKGFIVTDSEKITSMAFLIPAVADFQKNSENEADMFAAKYMKENNQKFQCDILFIKVAEGLELDTERYNSSKKRCDNLLKFL